MDTAIAPMALQFPRQASSKSHLFTRIPTSIMFFIFFMFFPTVSAFKGSIEERRWGGPSGGMDLDQLLLTMVPVPALGKNLESPVQPSQPIQLDQDPFSSLQISRKT